MNNQFLEEIKRRRRVYWYIRILREGGGYIGILGYKEKEEGILVY